MREMLKSALCNPTAGITLLSTEDTELQQHISGTRGTTHFPTPVNKILWELAMGQPGHPQSSTSEEEIDTPFHSCQNTAGATCFVEGTCSSRCTVGENPWTEEGRALQMKAWFYRMKGKITSSHRHVDLVWISLGFLVLGGFFFSNLGQNCTFTRNLGFISTSSLMGLPTLSTFFPRRS